MNVIGFFAFLFCFLYNLKIVDFHTCMSFIAATPPMLISFTRYQVFSALLL